MASKLFWRVQTDSSFTDYTPKAGFESPGHFYTDYCHWINAPRFRSHLTSKSRPSELTPFVSVFDDMSKAVELAQHLRDTGRTGIFIAEICLTVWEESELVINFPFATKRLPVVEQKTPGVGIVQFVSTPTIRKELGVEKLISQAEEWFALDHIPAELIVHRWYSF